MRHQWLDPFRGLAALWVVAHHLVCFAGEDAPIGPRWLMLGFFGVPMFFVISGYCVTAAARRAGQHEQPPFQFLLQRMMRIYPPFWAAILVSIVVYAMGPALWSAHTGNEWRAYRFTDWLNLSLLTKTFEPNGLLPWRKFAPINIAFWTLALEVQFYLVVGLCLFARRWFFAAILGITAISMWFILDESAYRSGLFLAHWPFFALGAGLVALQESKWVLPRGSWLLGLLVMGLGLSQSSPTPDGSRQMIFAEFVFAIGFAVLVWSTTSVELPRCGKPVEFLGTISYSVYLLHVPLLFATMDFASRILEFRSLPWGLLVVMLICALSYPFHLAFERPFIRSRKKPTAA
jgi:peptidoglycan/LPS O-acetylase OafA/YrhL